MRGRRWPAAKCTAWRRLRAVRAGRRLVEAAVSRRAKCWLSELQQAVAAHRQQRRRRAGAAWRWKWRPACCTSKPRSKTPISIIPSRRSASTASPQRIAAVRQAPRPSRSKAGWRNCTAASPTARRWAAWCRSCGFPVRSREARSTSSSATRRIANVLIPVPDQLAAMRGVLSVLGMDHASAAVCAHARRRRRADRRPKSTTQPDAGRRFERLAGNLGALGFLIDMLSVQPQMAKSLFVYDADGRHAEPGRWAARPRCVGADTSACGDGAGASRA